jgi:hypothetical protein
MENLMSKRKFRLLVLAIVGGILPIGIDCIPGTAQVADTSPAPHISLNVFGNLFGTH